MTSASSRRGPKTRGGSGRSGRALAVGLMLVLFIATTAFIVVRPDRPSRSQLQQFPFQGVTYTRSALDLPRPIMLHVVEIDLTAPGIDFLVTPGDPNSNRDLKARTTEEFLGEFGVQLAINGGYFDPFESQGGWPWKRQAETDMNVRGLAISQGQVYSDDFRFFPTLCFLAGQAQIRQNGCPDGTQQALSGSPLLVADGRPAQAQIARYRRANHPRTAVALDQAGQRLWLIVVDGRQRDYSEGVTLDELADIAVELGAHSALNLDGGGSTTLVLDGEEGPRTLNAPIHGRVPMLQREVANHLGVFALPTID